MFQSFSLFDFFSLSCYEVDSYCLIIKNAAQLIRFLFLYIFLKDLVNPSNVHSLHLIPKCKFLQFNCLIKCLKETLASPSSLCVTLLSFFFFFGTDINMYVHLFFFNQGSDFEKLPRLCEYLLSM